MGTRRSLAYAAGGLGAAAVAAVATGVVVERRVVRARRAGAAEADRLGTLRSEPVEITCDDGVVLHAEIDELQPYAVGKRRTRGEITLVFVHGYALNLDCWHFQREAFRGKYRMAFYDQRSHGRSERSDREHASIDQLGDDLATVIGAGRTQGQGGPGRSLHGRDVDHRLRRAAPEAVREEGRRGRARSRPPRAACVRTAP